MKKPLIILTAFIVLLGTILAACGETTTTTAPPVTTTTTTTSITTTTTTTQPTTTTTTPRPDKYGGILNEALTVGPATPLGYPPEAAPDAQAAARPAVESLLRIKKGGVVEPLLATGWTIAPDGKSVELTLRRGVKFHDGSDFNADAVKWNLDAEIAAKKAPEWVSVDVIDQYTVRVNITGYQNTVLTGFAEGRAMIVSPTAAEKNGLDWARSHPIGTGPFKFVEYERDARLVYERNDDYWQEGKPYLEGIEYTVIADETVRSIAMQRGDIHHLRAAGLTAQELIRMKFEYVTAPGGTYVLIPDSANPESPFADKRVRQAVSYAINRQALADALGYGQTKPAYQIYPSYTETALPSLEINEYNPDKARQLLVDAGYSEGFETTIHSFIRVVPRDYINAVAAMLEEVGIEVTTDFPEAGKYTELRFGGWDGVMGHALASFSNMNSSFTFYFTGTQFSSCQKPAGWDAALNAALREESLDPAKTQALVKLITDEVMLIPYLEETAIDFFQKGVNDTGYLVDSLTGWIPENAWLAPDLR